jgi:hypothetical protein
LVSIGANIKTVGLSEGRPELVARAGVRLPLKSICPFVAAHDEAGFALFGKPKAAGLSHERSHNPFQPA